MEKSTHKVEVIQVKMRKHPNADSLSIVDVFSYQVCVRTADWQDGALGAYIPPDSICPATEPFAFLGEHRRIKAKKLRGVVSFGLLVPAPVGSNIGDNVADILGVTHYEPPIPLETGGEQSKPPPNFCGSKYDVDSIRRYAHVFVPNEPVMVTEKIHGASSRYTFREGIMYVGSRTEWKKDNPKVIWREALKVHPEVEVFCRANEGCTVYGETYGQVQDLKYGVKSGVRFAAFDVAMPNSQWLNAEEGRDLLSKFNVPQVPLLGIIPFDMGAINKLADGKSTVPGADCIREGCVVKPLQERFHEEVGRVLLKMVGATYLTS